VQIFDLATRRCIQYFTFDQIPEERDGDFFTWSLDYFDNVVVVYTLRVVWVFAKTGELLHQFQMQKQGQRELEVVKGATRHSQVLYLNLEDGIFSFDICTGVSNELVAFANIDNPVLELVGVCFGRWLVAAAERYLQCGFKTRGILVYDLYNKCLEIDWMEGFYTKVTQCTESPSIFYALPLPSVSSSEDRGHVLELSTEGKLSRLSSFPVSIHGSFCCNFDHRIPLHDIILDSGVHVINTIDGKVEGSLAVPGYSITSMVPSGTEMLVALCLDLYSFFEPNAFIVSPFLSNICSCEFGPISMLMVSFITLSRRQDSHATR